MIDDPVRDDPILVLERELVAAAARRAIPAPSTQSLPAEAIEPGGHNVHRLHAGWDATGRPSTPRRRVGGGLAALGSTAIVIGVAVVALGALHGRPAATDDSSHHAAAGPARVTSRQALLNTIGALRRPLTAADMAAFKRSGLAAASARHELALAGGAIDAQSVRVATVTPWGSPVLLALVTPPTAVAVKNAGNGAPVAQTATAVAPAALAPREQVLMWVPQAAGAGQRGALVASVAEPGIQVGKGEVAIVAHPGSGGAAVRMNRFILVPNGVARVSITGSPLVPARRSARPLRLAVSAPVHGNLAILSVSSECCNGTVLTWYAPDGRVVKRLSQH